MSIKYINPGYVSMFDKNTLTQYDDPSYSNTGVSYCTTSLFNGMHIPYFDSPVMYLKFDLYIPSNPNKTNIYIRLPYLQRATDFDAYLYFSDTATNYGISNSTNTNANGSSYNSVYNTTLNIKLGGINTIYFVLAPSQRDINDAYCYMIINNTNRINNYAVFNKWKSSTFPDLLSIYVSSTSYKHYISNIIFSDSPIEYSERAIAVPINEVYTDMLSVSSDLYVADSANQSLLASLDINSLLNDVSQNSKVTGIMFGGNPMYTTGEGEVSIISKSNDSITEIDTIALSDNSIHPVFAGWTTDINLNDLSNMQLGLKVR